MKSFFLTKSNLHQKLFNKGKQVSLGLVSNIFQLILGKIIAWGFGPSGIILFTNLKQLIQIFSAFFTLNSENLVTIQVKKNGLNINNIKLIFNTYKRTFLLAVFPIFFFLIINNVYRPRILDDSINKYLFLLSSFLFAMNIIFFSMLNGIDKLIVAYRNQILGYFFSLIFLLVLLKADFDKNQLIIYYFLFLTTITFLLNTNVLYSSYNESKDSYLVESEGEKKNVLFSSFSVGITFSVYVIGNILQFLLRSKFVGLYSISSAGLIESAFTLSNYYTTILISLFTINSLSDLSMVKDINHLKKSTLRILFYGFFVLLMVSLILFFLRVNILRLFYNELFVKIQEFYGLLIFGDIFKVLAGILMVIIFAFGNMVKYFSIAMVSNFVTLVPLFFFHFNNIDDLGSFYIYSNFIYFVITFVIFFLGLKTDR